jgi:hypothetical protein
MESDSVGTQYPPHEWSVLVYREPTVLTRTQEANRLVVPLSCLLTPLKVSLTSILEDVSSAKYQIGTQQTSLTI